MADTDDLVSYYVNRLLWEYQKPKAQQTIAILIKQLVADGLLWQIEDGFTLDTAVGPQLDILGKYIGLPRTIGDPAPLPFFGFVDYVGANPQNMHGLTDYNSGVNNDAVFYTYGYNAQAATALSDTSYLLMLLFKIQLNISDNTLYTIQNILFTLFGGKVRVVDNANMSLTYYVGSNLAVSPGVLTPYLPKPMGVRIANVFVTLPIVTGTGDNIVTGTGDTIVAGNL